MSIETHIQTLTVEIQKLNGILSQLNLKSLTSTETASSAPTTKTAAKPATEKTKTEPATPTTSSSPEEAPKGEIKFTELKAPAQIDFAELREHFFAWVTEIKKQDPDFKKKVRALLDKFQTKPNQPVTKDLIPEGRYAEFYAAVSQAMSELTNG